MSVVTASRAPSSGAQASSRWHRAASQIKWRVEPFIGGSYRPSKATETFEDIDPATEAALCQVAVGDAADVDEAVRVARQRFVDGSWSELSPAKRAQVLLKFADLIAQHKDELALLDTLEMGKPIQAAVYDAEVYATKLVRTCAGFADKVVGVSGPRVGDTFSFNAYEPRGVVGAITPWNFPVYVAVIKIAPALAAGNTLVLKPSELSPSSALRLAELAIEAGVPEGVFNVVPGLGPTVGGALASHPDVNLISFTGSTTTGRKIMAMAGSSNGKPVLLEMGGKSPQVVFDDVENLDRVADAAVLSVLWNQGQVCSAHTRLVVHENVKDALVERIVDRATKHRPGDPLLDETTFGPLASPTQRDRVKRYIDQGLKDGANPVLLGEIQENGGCYVSPYVFDRVDERMSIWQEEIFGPVLCAHTFRTDEEAIALANGTEYGLVATAWTRDMGRGKRLAHRLKAGYVLIRTSGEEAPESGYPVSSEPQKASGFGSERGLRGIESYSTLKAVVMSGS